MNEYNCGPVLGSLVYRARGYKRLRDEGRIMSSKLRSSSMETLEDTKPYYGIVESNTVVTNFRFASLKKTLHLGLLVIVDRLESKRSRGNALVRMNTKEFSEYDFYWCPVEKLAIVDQKTWNLIAAVPSPTERTLLIRDVDLLNELTSIEIGSCVRVQSQSKNGTVTNICFKPELGPGTFFEVSFEDDDTPSYMKNERHNYFPVSDLRLSQQMCPSKKSRESLATRRRNEFFSDQCYSQVDMKQTESCSAYGLRSCKSTRFNRGERVVWVSEAGGQQGTICWLSPNGSNKLLVHLGSECKETKCTRGRARSISIDEVITEDEFNRKRNNIAQSRFSSSLNNNVRVDDLLGIDQLDNCMTRSHSFGNSAKDYGNEVKLGSDDDKSSTNTSNTRSGIHLSSEENSSNMDELGIGSMVEVSIGGDPHYGVIKFIGPITYKGRVHQAQMAGIEMEEEDKLLYGDGCLDDHRYFDCAPYRGHITPLEQCKKDSRFQDSPQPFGGEAKTPDDYGKRVIPGVVEPISQLENIHVLCGKYKGIQGHNNSCYLDATLFSMFTFTSVFDDLLYRPANDSDIQEYKEVQRVLREEIVNPLRKNHFVGSDSVMKLRTLLDSLTSVTGLTCEEKDPEEFLTSLVAQVLKAEPYLKLSSNQEAFYYQLFVEKDERLRLPTVQQLFEQSFITSDIKLKQVPSCLIIQMPRFGKSYKMYPRILPSQILDVTDVIENSLRQCSVCGQLAYYECKECFKDRYELEWISFCQNCVKKVHLHERRNQHKYTEITLPRDADKFMNSDSIPRHFMELFAVLCIETSHYVAFVKCGLGPDTPWCFFDSMADRKGGLSGYNIPEMVLCPDLRSLLEEGAQQAFCELEDDRYLDPYAKRLLCDAYMCLYQSTDVMMYR